MKEDYEGESKRNGKVRGEKGKRKGRRWKGEMVADHMDSGPTGYFRFGSYLPGVASTVIKPQVRPIRFSGDP